MLCSTPAEYLCLQVQHPRSMKPRCKIYEHSGNRLAPLQLAASLVSLLALSGTFSAFNPIFKRRYLELAYRTDCKQERRHGHASRLTSKSIGEQWYAHTVISFRMTDVVYNKDACAEDNGV